MVLVCNTLELNGFTSIHYTDLPCSLHCLLSLCNTIMSKNTNHTLTPFSCWTPVMCWKTPSISCSIRLAQCFILRINIRSWLSLSKKLINWISVGLWLPGMKSDRSEKAGMLDLLHWSIFLKSASIIQI